MINIEKINKIIDELESVSQDMKNAANISVEMEKSIKTFNLSIEKINEALTEIKKYDEKADSLSEQTKNLVEKLQDIRNDYHKVSTAIELVEGDFKNIQKNLENIGLEIKNLANNLISKVEELNQKTIDDFGVKVRELKKHNKEIGDSVVENLDKTTKVLKAENKELRAQLDEIKNEVGLIKKIVIGFGIAIGIIALIGLFI